MKYKVEELRALLAKVNNDEVSASYFITLAAPMLIEEIERLQAFEKQAVYTLEENRKLREALQFYADKENHNFDVVGCITCSLSPIDYDDGQKARKALGIREDWECDDE